MSNFIPFEDLKEALKYVGSNNFYHLINPQAYETTDLATKTRAEVTLEEIDTIVIGEYGYIREKGWHTVTKSGYYANKAYHNGNGTWNIFGSMNLVKEDYFEEIGDII